ncbi:MAG: hypothetical protein QOJ64_2264 [Acidobacteriota bacterium]|jgi:hypothetical protein|nr:hypothetical protein [Acidobacteriota bacterium]
MFRLTYSLEAKVATKSTLLALALPMLCVAASAQIARKKVPQNLPPTVTLIASPTTLCYGGEVRLFADAKDPDGDKLTYKYTTSTGKLVGSGRRVRWGFDQLGHHRATVEVSDGRGGIASSSAFIINFELCNCPVLIIDGSVNAAGSLATFSLSLMGPADLKPAYTWTISAGKMVSGKRNPTLTVDTTGVQAETVTATVKIGGLDPECENMKTFTLNRLSPATPKN